MDVDAVYERIGEFGHRQRLIFFVLQGTMQPFLQFHMLHMIFIGAIPEFICLGDSGVAYPDEMKCSSQECAKGQHWILSNNFSSIASEWTLLCQQSYKVGLVQSVFMAGVLISSYIFGSLSDKHGRLKIFNLTLIGFTVISTLSAFATSYTCYILLRFLTGFFCGGCILVSFVLVTEIIGSSWRGLCGMLMPVFFAFGILIHVLLAYYVRNWRHLAFITSAIGFVFMFFYYWLLPESPRWLVSQNRIEEAEEILRTIAKYNGSTFPPEKIKLAAPKTGSVQKKHSVADICKYTYIRNLTCVQVYSWFVNSVVYYGLTMSAGNLGSNMYISVALSGLVEMPAYFGTMFLLTRIGRKTNICSMMLVGGISCMLIMIIPKEYELTVTGCAMVGKLAIAASFAIIYIHSAELFPTVIRNMALGITSVGARFGGIVAPIIASLASVNSALPYLIFGALAFSAGLLNLYLPETKDQPMPETLEDVLTMGFNSRKEPHDKKVTNNSAEDRVKLLEEMINADAKTNEFIV